MLDSALRDAAARFLDFDIISASRPENVCVLFMCWRFSVSDGDVHSGGRGMAGELAGMLDLSGDGSQEGFPIAEA